MPQRKLQQEFRWQQVQGTYGARKDTGRIDEGIKGTETVRPFLNCRDDLRK